MQASCVKIATQMYNILFIHGVSAIGGSERDLLSLIKNLSPLKYFPIVICPDKGPLYAELKKLDIKIEILNIPPWRKGKYILSIPIAIYRIRKIIAKNNIDLIHVNDFWYFPITFLAARPFNIPVITHIRQEIEVPKIKKYWLSYSDMLLPVSNSIKNTILMSGIQDSRIMTLYSGLDIEHIPNVDAEMRRILNINSDQPVIGTVATIDPRKGYEYLIEALAEIKKNYGDIKCVIVGDGDSTYKSKLGMLSKRLGVSDNIVYVGFQHNVYPYISMMDIFVLPSIMEGFGIVILEAMAMSKPIVATKVGGIPEIVADNITGILIEPKDPISLASAILSILDDSEKRSLMGMAGRKRVELFFSIKVTIKTLEEVYENILNAKKFYG